MRNGKMACLALLVALVSGFMIAGPVSAQVVTVYYPAPPPPVPVVSYYPPPTVSYSYYPPTTVSYSYYPPATTVYAAPATVYSAPTMVYSPATAVYTPGTVTTTGVETTRSYLGLGIYRPFGINRVTTYTPTTVEVSPPRVTYYSPVFVP